MSLQTIFKPKSLVEKVTKSHDSLYKKLHYSLIVKHDKHDN